LVNDYQIIPDGDTPTLAALHSEEFKEEYEKLDEAELAEIVDAHESHGCHQRRPTARSRVNDVTSTLRTIRDLVLCFFFSLEFVSNSVY
jgi:hypothetical protein